MGQLQNIVRIPLPISRLRRPWPTLMNPASLWFLPRVQTMEPGRIAVVILQRSILTKSRKRCLPPVSGYLTIRKIRHHHTSRLLLARLLVLTNAALLMNLPVHPLVIFPAVCDGLAPPAPLDLFPRSTDRANRASYLRLAACPSLKRLFLNGLPRLYFTFNVPTHATDDDCYMGIVHFVEIGHWRLQNGCDRRSAANADGIGRRATSALVLFHERQHRTFKTVGERILFLDFR
jgi:hypothetical protein